MSDSHTPAVEPVSPTGEPAAVQPVQSARGAPAPGPRNPSGHAEGVAAVTGGSLSAAYAEFVVNPDTHDVVIRIRELGTDRIINQYPSREVEAMSAYMRQYAETLARMRAARRARADER
jgi:FlaG protein